MKLLSACLFACRFRFDPGFQRHRVTGLIKRGENDGRAEREHMRCDRLCDHWRIWRSAKKLFRVECSDGIEAHGAQQIGTHV